MVHGQNHKESSYNIGRILCESISCTKEVEEFFLPRDLNHFCLGCYACIEDETKCPYYKEKNLIMTAVENADLLIFTTPNYCMGPSAPMKAFMDLTFTYWLPHKPRACMFSKRAVVISTTAGAGASKAIKPLSRMLSYWGISSIRSYGVAVSAMKWRDVANNKKAKIRKDILKLAEQLSQKGNVTTSIKTKLLFTIMTKMQKGNLGSSPTERLYWEKQGWFNGNKPWIK